MRPHDPYPDVDLPPEDDQDDEMDISPAYSEAVLQKSLAEGLTKSPLWATIVAKVRDEIAKREKVILETVVNDASRDSLNAIKGERSGLMMLEAYVRDLYGAADEVAALYRKADQVKERENGSNN